MGAKHILKLRRDRGMFDKEYQFRGKHAEMVLRLTGNLDKEIGKGLFRSNYDVYEIAPIIGYLFKRKAPLDRSEPTTKIFRDKVMDEAEELKYNFRVLMMLIDKETKSIDERVDIAFRLESEDEKRLPYDLIYDEYVRGGVEVLYEHIFKDAKDTDEYIINLYNFLQEFNNRYYVEIEEEF